MDWVGMAGGEYGEEVKEGEKGKGGVQSGCLVWGGSSSAGVRCV
jgi:hypothetical protein